MEQLGGPDEATQFPVSAMMMGEKEAVLEIYWPARPIMEAPVAILRSLSIRPS
ncbi:hypothetical protein [Desulfobulbus sp.]|uniref:hypothetical protein n=1 Tax=Desulfobulbus sp. TaxID=895 RepID=UPI00286EF438|nr:hypothetical protein [Desulfobulbus sp.]